MEVGFYMATINTPFDKKKKSNQMLSSFTYFHARSKMSAGNNYRPLDLPQRESLYHADQSSFELLDDHEYNYMFDEYLLKEDPLSNINASGSVQNPLYQANEVAESGGSGGCSYPEGSSTTSKQNHAFITI
jgi:hypothetical protein